MTKTIEVPEELFEAISNIVETLQKDKAVSPELPKKKWEPEAGDWCVSTLGDFYNTRSTIETKNYGVERQTEVEAKKALCQMRSHNRLLAYVAEFDGGWEADWRKVNQAKCRVNYNSGVYKVGHNWEDKILGCVYMSKECAENLVEKLNSGEVVL